MFTHERSTVGYGLRRARWGAGLGLLASAMIFFAFTFVLMVLGVMLLAIAAYVLITGLLRVILPRRWRIQVGDGVFVHSSPWGLGESFAWPLEELERVERRRPLRGGDAAAYRVLRRDGEARDLTPRSGVKFQQLVAALEKEGVSLSDVRTL